MHLRPIKIKCGMSFRSSKIRKTNSELKVNYALLEVIISLKGAQVVKKSNQLLKTKSSLMEEQNLLKKSSSKKENEEKKNVEENKIEGEKKKNDEEKKIEEIIEKKEVEKIKEPEHFEAISEFPPMTNPKVEAHYKQLGPFFNDPNPYPAVPLGAVRLDNDAVYYGDIINNLRENRGKIQWVIIF